MVLHGVSQEIDLVAWAYDHVCAARGERAVREWLACLWWRLRELGRLSRAEGSNFDQMRAGLFMAIGIDIRVVSCLQLIVKFTHREQQLAAAAYLGIAPPAKGQARKGMKKKVAAG